MAELRKQQMGFQKRKKLLMSDITEENLKVKQWVEDYKLTTFVETGCFEGSTLEFFTSLGLKCYSCDINSDYVKNCENKFPDATIYLGESVSFFKEWLPKITERSYFWLDAHHPAMYQRPKLFTMDNYFPLFQELQLIKELKPNYQYDIILCDDINTVEAEDNSLCNPEEIPPEVLTAKGHLLQEYKDIFKDTHNAEVLLNGFGLLAFFPKEK